MAKRPIARRPRQRWKNICDALAEDVLLDAQAPAESDDAVSRMRERLAGFTAAAYAGPVPEVPEEEKIFKLKDESDRLVHAFVQDPSEANAQKADESFIKVFQLLSPERDAEKTYKKIWELIEREIRRERGVRTMPKATKRRALSGRQPTTGAKREARNDRKK